MDGASHWLFWDVDTQRDFMLADGALYVPDAEAIIPNLERLTRAADRQGIAVVASADDHEWSDPEISDVPDFRETYPPHCMRGSPGAERIPETQRAWSLQLGHEPLERARLEEALRAARPSVLIHKKSVDVFSNPNTEAVVAVLAPERILLYGVALDICNRFAIEGLLARGHRLTLVADAARPVDPARGLRLVAAWRERGVEIATTGRVVAEVESQGPAGVQARPRSPDPAP